MKKDFETNFTGWAFIVAAILLWGGWALSPHHIGEYIVQEDFAPIGESIWFWIWMFRFHIFGWVMMVVAVFAFSAITSKEPSRVMIIPGAGMLIIGTFTLAIAAAFYYNYGAWGVGMTMDKSPEEVSSFMNDILYTNQYVTCFVRFGRIFSGVGLVILGAALVKWNIVKSWLGYFTIALGLVAIGIILAIPEYYEYYKPVFHVKSLWLVIMGIYILRQGVNLSETES